MELDHTYITELIRHPEKATENDVLNVQQLLYQYPYFQAARILYLKLLALSNYPEFIKALPLSAIYAGDRKRLYYYIHPKHVKLANESEAISSPVQVDEEPLPEEASKEDVVLDLPEKEDELLLVTEEQSVEDEWEDEDASDTIEVRSEEKPRDVLKELQSEEKKQLKNVVAIIKQQQEQQKLAAETDEEFEEELSDKGGNETAEEVLNHSEDVDETVESESEETEEEISEPSAFEMPETFSFTGWLDTLTKPVAEAHGIIGSDYQLDEEAASTENKNEAQWDLIDNFINDYKPSKPQLDDAANTREASEDLSNRKPVQQKEIVTETLADIFLAQKKYDKAIELFEKLGLKYPEKNTYFASQIKKAKKLKKKE